MTDAWLVHGRYRICQGEPNGVPIDEWGIRMEAGSCNPARRKRLPRWRSQWPGLRSTRSVNGMSGSATMHLRAQRTFDFYQSLPALSQGNVAQQIFWYTAFTADMVKPQSEGNNTVDADGNPLWRMAPSPHGPYWEEGQKVGYQDVGSWTFLKSTPSDRAQAAWLYAQFVTSKTVDVKKSHVGLTFIRDSSVNHESFTERAPKLGGLVEFYRSPDRVRWSPTGVNVPDYPKLAQIWWQQIGDVNSGAFTPQEAMDRLAEEMDITMARMQRADEGSERLWWLWPASERRAVGMRPTGSASQRWPKAKLENEKPQGETVNYDELVARW